VTLRLSDAGLKVRDVGDVYRALARLGRAQEAPPVAVVVCMDDLAASEIEFFSLVRRIHRGLAVYVYATDGARERAARAIALGATGELTDEAFAALGEWEPTAYTAPPTNPPPDAPSSGVPRRIDRPDDNALHETRIDPPESDASRAVRRDMPDDDGDSDPWIEPIDDDDDEIAPPRTDRSGGDETREPSVEPQPVRPSAASDEDGESALPAAARFPWRRYEDGPRRTPPTRRSPATAGESNADGPDRSDRTCEPLLTDEELRALIGDHSAPAESDDDLPRGDDARPDEGARR
jgi:hypothetical protein